MNTEQSANWHATICDTIRRTINAAFYTYDAACRDYQSGVKEKKSFQVALNKWKAMKITADAAINDAAAAYSKIQQELNSQQTAQGKK